MLSWTQGKVRLENICIWKSVFPFRDSWLHMIYAFLLFLYSNKLFPISTALVKVNKLTNKPKIALACVFKTSQNLLLLSDMMGLGYCGLLVSLGLHLNIRQPSDRKLELCTLCTPSLMVLSKLPSDSSLILIDERFFLRFA